MPGQGLSGWNHLRKVHEEAEAPFIPVSAARSSRVRPLSKLRRLFSEMYQAVTSSLQYMIPNELKRLICTPFSCGQCHNMGNISSLTSGWRLNSDACTPDGVGPYLPSHSGQSRHFVRGALRRRGKYPVASALTILKILCHVMS